MSAHCTQVQAWTGHCANGTGAHTPIEKQKNIAIMTGYMIHLEWQTAADDTATKTPPVQLCPSLHVSAVTLLLHAIDH